MDKGLKKAYLPLCDYFAQKVGGTPELWTIVNGGTAIFGSMFIALAATGGNSLVAGVALLGVSSSVVLSDLVLPPILRKKNVSSKKGGQIIRSAQVASVAAPLALGIALHFAMAGNGKDSDPLLLDIEAESIEMIAAPE